MIAVWSIVLGGSLVVFAALIAVVFPRIFLKEGEIDTPPSDRGLKKVKEPNGKSILFEPSVEMRKYVRQYILSERGEKKVIGWTRKFPISITRSCCSTVWTECSGFST